jgi:hypothetical protein
MPVVLATFWFTTGSADAFVGESLVISPGGGGLTEAAKTIITNPTFIPENVGEAGAAGGAGEASGAAGVFETAGALPALGGSLLAFGVGAGIGTEICHVLGISGCWDFSSGSSADPSVGTGSWVFKTTPFGGGPAYNWYWASSGTSVSPQPFYGQPATPSGLSCAGPAPGGVSFFLSASKVGELKCELEKVVYEPLRYYAIRYSMQNRTLSYNSTDDPSTPDYEPGGKPYTAPSNWPGNLAKAMQGHSGDSAAKVGERIANAIKPSEVPDPYATTKVPNCTGLLWLPCKKELEELELKPGRSELVWEKALLTKPADAVVEVKGAGSKVVPGSKVTVITNPNEAGMPLVIPAPESGETYSHYASRLNPGLEAERHDLEASFVEPALGPNAVVAVSPEVGTRLDPATKHTVRVSTNPGDVPAAGLPWSPPSIPSIDIGPISGIPSPCTVFPFGLLCWMGEAFGQFETAGVCPHAEVPVWGKTNFDLTLCGETSDQVMSVVRPIVLVMWIIGLGFLFAKATKALGGDD